MKQGRGNSAGRTKGGRMNDVTLQAFRSLADAMRGEQVQCERSHYCQCAGNGNEAVQQLPETGRWFISMGHAGFNSAANNRNGYATERSARNAVAHYQGKSQRVGR
jgi:hypothetical protein